MTYGQQPGTNDGQPGGVPPVPQSPTTPYGAQQPSYGAPPAYGAQPSYGAQSGYGAQQPSYGAPDSYGQNGVPATPGAPWQGAGYALPRPGTVTAGSVLAFIGGGFMVLIGGILAIAGGAAGLEESVADQFGREFGALIAGLGVAVLVAGALIVFFGVMAFRGKRWGAIALAVVAGLSVLGGISDLAGGTGGSSLLGVAWGVTSAVLLLVSQSQAWYRSKA